MIPYHYFPLCFRLMFHGFGSWGTMPLRPFHLVPVPRHALKRAAACGPPCGTQAQPPPQRRRVRGSCVPLSCMNFAPPPPLRNRHKVWSHKLLVGPPEAGSWWESALLHALNKRTTCDGQTVQWQLQSGGAGSHCAMRSTQQVATEFWMPKGRAFASVWRSGPPSRVLSSVPIQRVSPLTASAGPQSHTHHVPQCRPGTTTSDVPLPPQHVVVGRCFGGSLEKPQALLQSRWVCVTKYPPPPLVVPHPREDGPPPPPGGRSPSDGPPPPPGEPHYQRTPTFAGTEIAA